MLQTNPISGPAPAPADLAPAAPAPSTRTAALRIEDGIAFPSRSVRAAITRARSSASRARTSSAKSRATGYAKASSKKDDFAFLRDPKLTIEQKLVRFMAMMAKKLDQDIQRRMEEMAPKEGAKKTSSSKSSSSKKSSAAGLFGKALSGILKSKPVKDLLKQVAGPVLASGASAFGLPALAPLLLRAGPALGQVVGELVGGLAGGSASSSSRSSSGSRASSSSSSSSGASGMGDGEQRVKLMELQQLIDKQKEMFTLVSNMLRSFHDMRMSSINNIR